MDVPEGVVGALAVPVAAAVPVIAARIPAGPAADLGRLGAPPDAGVWAAGVGIDEAFAPADVRDAVSIRAVPARAFSMYTGAVPAESPVLSALGTLQPLLAERLLGALELTVPGLDLAGAPDLSPYLGQPVAGGFAFAHMVGGESQAVTAATMLERLRPGTAELVVSLAKQLAARPLVAPLPAIPPGAAEEASIAAAHGTAYLALAVATASAVVGRWSVPAPVESPAAAVVGLAIGTAILLLREAPMPAGYAAALLAKARAEYLLPLETSGSVPVSENRFALVEGEVPEVADFGGNGLVAVVAGGAVIRTGVAEGSVKVRLTVLAEPPPPVEPGWDEVVEVSWRAAAGLASVTGPHARAGAQLRRATPPWPGDYRLRVHARGRDDAADDHEYYELVVWQAPAAPEIVHKRTDRLGHRLRGEPEPARVDRPEAAYRWVRRSALGEAATVTVVTGATVEEVLRAFGADPAQPESSRSIAGELMDQMSIDPWVAVLDTGDAVLAVEYNGFQGADEPVLRRASAGGRAASMFWNVNGVTRLSFAEGGRLLASFEPSAEAGGGPAVASALAGLDFDDYWDTEGKGLVAVQRFTGRGITEDDLARIESADIGFRIVPDLPALYPHPRWPAGSRTALIEGPLGRDTEALARLPEPRLRDLAWWAAAEAARYAGLAGDPDIAASIAARALTADAQWRARRSQLHGGEHPSVWLALHRATNPDPLAAAVGAVDAARFAAGPHAAELVDSARRWL